MTDYMLIWNSSPYERYDTDMMDRARDVLQDAGYSGASTFGGTGVGDGWDDPTASDNGFDIAAESYDDVRDIADKIEAVVGHKVTVRRYEDDE